MLILIACGRKGAPTLKAYEKPQSPYALSAVHKEDKIVLSWSYPEDLRPAVKGFQLLRSEGNDFERIAFIKSSDNSFIETEFKEGVRYRYKVIAQNLKDIFSDGSNIIFVMPRPLPLPPQDIKFEIKDDIELTWSSSGKDACYNIYRTFEKGKYLDSPINRAPVCAAFFKDRVSPDKTAYYRISALLNTDIKDEGYLSAEIAVSHYDFMPAPPSDLRIVMGDDKVHLIWKESPESWVKGYRIYRKDEGEAEFRMLGETKTPAFTDSTKVNRRALYMIKALGPSNESKALTGEFLPVAIPSLTDSK